MFLRYVSRPTSVEAVYWDGTDVVLDALFDKGCHLRYDLGELQIMAGVDGAQGYVDVPVGHYVICAAPNDFYPCAKKYFEDKYEPEGAVVAEDV